jgi:hypothetical protein
MKLKIVVGTMMLLAARPLNAAQTDDMDVPGGVLTRRR